MNDSPKSITVELEQRIQSAAGSIAEAAMESNLDKVQTIASATKRLEEVSKKMLLLKKDIRKAITEFDAATRSHTKAKQTKLLITIRWVLAGENKADERIDEDSAADALSHFISSLVNVLGEGILPDIARIQIGNSGLVSQDPKGDFRNPNNDQAYGYRPIGKTGWAVKTHSSTAQKDEQIQQISTALELPRRAINVEVIEKQIS